MPEHRFYHVSPAGKIQSLPSLAEALSARKAAGYIWLDFFCPSREDLLPLVDSLGVHPLSVEDCLDDDQIPKIENFPTSTFLLVNAYRFAGKSLTIEERDFILGSDYLVTVSRSEHPTPPYLRESLRLDLECLRRGPDFLLQLVLDFTVDQKGAALEAIQDEIDAVEGKILQDTSLFHPADLTRLRKQLLTLRKSLFHERETLVKACRRDSPFISEKAVYHFRDIYDHLAKYFEMVEISRDMITSLMEMYLSMVNNQMSLSANRTNRVVRRLTFITTIFMPLTLLAGIGGMSEWTMMTGPENWKISYPIFFAATLLIGLVSYHLLRWVEGRPSRTSPHDGPSRRRAPLRPRSDFPRGD
ncbi:MAG: magnesium transporter CorA family protein [Acidobacteria bacterium]|nr:magnesium transporter CorA family protein [Acidobacteriota bacterium]